MFTEVINNLQENTMEERFQEHTGALNSLYQYLGFNKKDHYHMKWDITEEDINTEKDRGDHVDITFTFVIRWLQYEKGKLNSEVL